MGFGIQNRKYSNQYLIIFSILFIICQCKCMLQISMSKILYVFLYLLFHAYYDSYQCACYSISMIIHTTTPMISSTMVDDIYIVHLTSPGGQSMYFIMLNTFVHIIMYSYYFLSIYKPHLQWKLFKRAVTTIQLVSVYKYCRLYF